MNIKKFIFCTLFVLLSFPLGAKAKPQIYVVNYPLKYFAERIGGAQIEVHFPAPSGVDPAFWMPDTKTITDYQKADLILLNGANYAKWIGKVTLPKAKMVDTSAAFKDQYITTEDTITHQHGPEGDHSHRGLAFTTWLNFQFAAKQAQAVKNALARLMPEQEKQFANNYKSLEKDLLGLDQELTTLVAAKKSQPLLASHPVYQYLAQRYGLNLMSMLWEPGVFPNSNQWEEFKILHQKKPGQWMIWESYPLEKTRNKLKSLGVNRLVFDPCGNIPELGDFLKVMKQNITNLKKAFL